MSIETQLRDALASHAASIEPVEAHPYERVAGAVAKNRTRRRTVGAAAVAVVAAIAIGVPAATSRFGDGDGVLPSGQVQLPPASDKAWNSVTTWPTRGALAGDTTLVAAIGEQFDGRPIFVEDLGATRVAVVVSYADLVAGTGPRGASAADMRRSSTYPASDVPGMLSMVGGGGLVVLATPDRTSVEVSKTPDIALDGTVSRTWQSLALIKGVGRTQGTELTRLREGGIVAQPRFLFRDDETTTRVDPCGGECTQEQAGRQERATNALVANLMGVDPQTVITETVFRGPVSRDFATMDSTDIVPQLLMVHSRLSGGQVLRTAWLSDENEMVALELARPIDAPRAATVPLISFGWGSSGEAPTKVHVVVPDGTAVRAVGDKPWPSSDVIPLTNHMATFEVPVSADAFDQNYRIEVLNGDRVVTAVRTARSSLDVFDGTP